MKELSVSNPPAKEEEKPQEPQHKKPQETTEKTEPKEKNESKDRPYPADYFSIPEWGRIITEPELDSYGLKDKVVFIESYLSERLQANGMKSDRDGVYEVLRDIERQIGTNDKFQPHIRVRKVYNFIQTIKMSSEAEEERKKKLLALLKKH